jgi:ATP-dependent DNA helicase DinG
MADVTFDLDTIFGKNGLLRKASTAYEYRAQQVEMAAGVWHTLSQGGHLVCEAGPGTGKTFAYLVPAIYSGYRVVVSTGTKNLQDQIYHRDIPFLREVLPVDFRAAYMKGRENYLCWRRFELFGRQPLFTAVEEVSLFKQIDHWSTTTATGDRAELSGMPDDASVWHEICCHRDQCLGTECPHHNRCFLTRMRQQAAAAQIVVVNHHLFFADLAIRARGMEIIPRYTRVVFDEAHQLEDVVTNHFGIAVSTYRLEDLIGDIRRELTSKSAMSPGTGASLDGLARKSSDLFSLFRAMDRHRITGIDTVARSLLEDTTRELDNLRNKLGGQPPQEEISTLMRRCEEIKGDLEFILSMGDPTYVYWCETRGRGTFLRASPIDVGPELTRHLYPHTTSLVFTSATLSTHQGFTYFEERLGLSATTEVVLSSPFDFRRQVAVYLPAHMPDPTTSDYLPAAVDEIETILTITSGRAFILCTSYRNMREFHQTLQGRLPYTTLMQGEKPPHLLLADFTDDLNSVLFATASFWEGVDVPGEALSCVIIDRLPFDPPTEPIHQARIERIANLGDNPFYRYQIPAAIISLKQGLGRLIRTRTDRGLLAILDSRIHTKSYGRLFLQSLPPAPVATRHDELAQLFEDTW